jgi:outer membrane lipopolysaccharide assembly protein LptE/RlpB
MQQPIRLAALLVLLLSGCGFNTAPVLQIRNAPVVTARHGAVSQSEVRDAIARALASRSWTIQEEAPGALTGQITAGGHTASVLIRYDAQHYSITYVSSSAGLLYNGTSIHRRYNHWIDRLRASITQELSKLQGEPPPVYVNTPQELPPAPPPPSPAKP